LRRSNSAPEKADIAIGTVCARSSRRCAVTTIDSRLVELASASAFFSLAFAFSASVCSLAGGVVCAKAGDAGVTPIVPMANATAMASRCGLGVIEEH